MLREFAFRAKLRSVIGGAGNRGQKIVSLMKKFPETGYDFKGYIDDLDAPNILGPLSEVPRILAGNVIDEIIICLPIKTYYDKMQSITEAAEEQGITVRIYSDLFDLKLSRAVAGELGEAPILSIHASRISEWQSFMKTSIDLSVIDTS